MEINRFKIQVGKFTAELEEKLDRDKDCILTIPVGIYDVGTPDKQDGTFDMIYKTKNNGAIDVRQTERLVKGKDKSSASKKTRDFIYWQGQGKNIVDTQGFYEEVLQVFRTDSKYVEEIISKINIEDFR